MWRTPGWTSSALLLLWSSSALASWQVELRPLDQAPYGLHVEHLYALQAKSGLSHLEGSGVQLAPGQTTAVVDVPLPDSGAQRQLEFQLGYLVAGAKPSPANACAMDITIEGLPNGSRHVDVPLRSIEAAEEPFESLRGEYDYLLPQVTFALSEHLARLSIKIAVAKSCAVGAPVFFDPKVWANHPGDKVRRIILIATDSISSDWFANGRHFAPAVERFFSSKNGGTLNTQVVSAGSNTHDTTHTLSRMRFAIRDGATVAYRGSEVKTGLVPGFLNAGYEVLSFNSNLLLSSAWEEGGIRNLYNLNVAGSPNNDRNPEIQVGMMESWLKRHADHDVFFYSWFDATHTHGPTPMSRPEVASMPLPYSGPARVLPIVAQQARSLSYVDLVLERFFQNPAVQESDVLFFSDHGINFDSFEHPEPVWGSCTPLSMPANWHLQPVEIRIPVGLRLPGLPAPAVAVESSLIDWVYTAVKRHHPRVDVSAWEGRDVESLRPDSPLLSASHGKRASMRVNGDQLLFSDDVCSENAGGFFLRLDGTPASPAQIETFVSELARRDLLRYQRIDYALFEGDPTCQVELDVPWATTSPQAKGAALQVRNDSGQWLRQASIFVPTALGFQLARVFYAGSPGCGVLQVATLRRSLRSPVDLLKSGLWHFMTLPLDDLQTTSSPVLRLAMSPGFFVPKGGEFRPVDIQVAPSAPTQLSTEMQTAMKRWGYIQDDHDAH